MQTHGTVGNRQTKSNASCFTIPRFIDPVKRTKDFAKSIFRNSWPVVANSDDRKVLFSV